QSARASSALAFVPRAASMNQGLSRVDPEAEFLNTKPRVIGLQMNRTGSHQKRPERSATNAIEIKQNQSMRPINILPLITVWLQVRVLPGPPRFALRATRGAATRGLEGEAWCPA